jgi:hypothetical protein
MNSIKAKALILLFLHLTHSAVLHVTQDHLEVPERELANSVAVLVGGLLSGLFAYKYATHKSLTHWKDDQNWDKRFLQATSEESYALSFLNLLLDSFAMEMSNACLFHFQSKYELTCNTKKDQVTAEEYNIFEDEQYAKLEEKRDYCMNFFSFVLNYSFINKYMMDAKYAIFYFNMSFVESGAELPESFVTFLKEMKEQVFFSEKFRKIENTHQNYFYITVNYFMDSKNQLRKLTTR